MAGKRHGFDEEYEEYRYVLESTKLEM